MGKWKKIKQENPQKQLEALRQLFKPNPLHTWNDDRSSSHKAVINDGSHSQHKTERVEDRK